MATVTVIIDPPIEVDILSQECSPDDLFLIVLFEISNDGIVSSDVGTLMSTGGLSYQLDVPTDETEFTITIVDPNNMSCVYEYEFDVPECGCQFIPAPDVDPEYILCLGDEFPDIEAINDQDFSANWFDETGIDIILDDSEEFTPSEAGTYFVQTFDVLDPSCTSELVEFEIIVETPPNPGMDSTIVMCQGFDMDFDLMTLLSGNPDVGGAWSDVLMTGLNISDPSNVNFSPLPSGTYTFTYEVNGDACPDASANLVVDISLPPNPGMDVDTSVCVGSDVLLDMIQMIAPADAGGVWMEVSGMIDLNTPDQVTIQSLPAGVYLIEYMIPGMDQMSPYCDSVSSTITLEIIEQLSAGMDNQVSECIGGSLSILSYLVDNDALGIIEPVDPTVMIVGDVMVNVNLLDEQGIVVSTEMLMLNGNSSFDICNINNGSLSVLDLEPDQNYSLELISFVFMGCEYDLNESIEIVSGASGVLDYSETLCSNQEVILGGVVFNQGNPSGSVDVPIPNACDSLINVDLDFFDPVESFIDGSVCSSFSILVNGTNYNSSNPFGVEVIANGASNSCDSTVFVNLDFSIDNEMIDICLLYTSPSPRD